LPPPLAPPAPSSPAPQKQSSPRTRPLPASRNTSATSPAPFPPAGAPILPSSATLPRSPPRCGFQNIAASPPADPSPPTVPWPHPATAQSFPTPPGPIHSMWIGQPSEDKIITVTFHVVLGKICIWRADASTLIFNLDLPPFLKELPYE
jgi:hypothetical protein